MKYSIVIPVYKNADSIPRLLLALDELSQNLDRDMEAVFVIDGSPDNSVTMLQSALPTLSFPVQLVGFLAILAPFLLFEQDFLLPAANFLE